jgi:hypothetical protein
MFDGDRQGGLRAGYRSEASVLAPRFRTTFDFSRKYRTAPLQDVTQTPEICLKPGAGTGPEGGADRGDRRGCGMRRVPRWRRAGARRASGRQRLELVIGQTDPRLAA